jgi:hypothetical protein
VTLWEGTDPLRAPKPSQTPGFVGLGADPLFAYLNAGYSRNSSGISGIETMNIAVAIGKERLLGSQRASPPHCVPELRR